MAQNDVKYQIKGGFFNAQWIGENDPPAVSYDRVYDSEDMVQPYRNVVTDGIFAYQTTVDSESPKAEMGFSCSVDGTTGVILQAGSGLLNHRWFELDHVENIEVSQNSTLTARIDSLIIQCNLGMNDRCMYLIYRQGTASAPALETDGSTIFEFRLWNISVPSNQVGGNITLEDKRGTDECPIITGLLQQLSLEDRLNQFDADVAEKLDEIDNELNDKLSGMDSQFQGKLSQYDAQYNTKISQYDSQFQQKLISYDNSMTQIWAEWESLKSQIGTGGGGGTIVNGNTLKITRGYISYTSGTVTIDDYDAETDTIFVFINGLYANTTNDYSIDSTGVITFKNTINSGADIDWWKFRITEASGGGGGGDTEPVQDFALSVRSYEGTDIPAESDGSYKLSEGVSYFALAPLYMGTYRWEAQDGSDTWNPVENAESNTLVIIGGEHTAVRCIVNYNDTDYISKGATFTMDITGTAEDPVIQITEDDGYVHQTESSEPEPTEKVATPVIEVS